MLFLRMKPTDDVNNNDDDNDDGDDKDNDNDNYVEWGV